jgi:hypothetical protein
MTNLGRRGILLGAAALALGTVVRAAPDVTYVGITSFRPWQHRPQALIDPGVYLDPLWRKP